MNKSLLWIKAQNFNHVFFLVTGTNVVTFYFNMWKIVANISQYIPLFQRAAIGSHNKILTNKSIDSLWNILSNVKIKLCDKIYNQ